MVILSSCLSLKFLITIQKICYLIKIPFQKMSSLKSIGVFCGASAQINSVYATAAYQLGKILAKEKLRLFYGGVQTGLMGILSNSILDAGGEAYGFVSEDLSRFEVPNKRLTTLVSFPTMSARKKEIFTKADGFVALPGGLGTLDELIEVLTWKKVCIHTKPIVILNINKYWDPLHLMIERMIQEGFAKFSLYTLFKFVDSVNEVMPALRALQAQEYDVSQKLG